MDVEWLEDFIRLAEEGNFSRAAEARNLSQPAFSRRIRTLEEWVGTPLVDRDTHRIALTTAGDVFCVVAAETMRQLNLGRDEARSIGRNEAGTLRFAATHALSVTFFPDWLSRFPLQSDVGQVSLVADNMAACERVMLEGRADLLLCHQHPAATTRLDPAGFRWRSIGNDELLPVSVPAEGGGARFALPGAASDPLPALEFDEQSGMGRIIAASQIVSAGGAALRSVFRSHLASVLLAFARDGRGLTWTPRSLAQRDLDAGLLVAAGDDRWTLPIEIRLYRPRARCNPAVEAFWNALPPDATSY